MDSRIECFPLVPQQSYIAVLGRFRVIPPTIVVLARFKGIPHDDLPILEGLFSVGLADIQVLLEPASRTLVGVSTSIPSRPWLSYFHQNNLSKLFGSDHSRSNIFHRYIDSAVFYHLSSTHVEGKPDKTQGSFISQSGCLSENILEVKNMFFSMDLVGFAHLATTILNKIEVQGKL